MRRVARFVLFWGSVGFLSLVGFGIATYLAFAFVPAVGTVSVGAVHESLADETGGIADGLVGENRCRALRRPRAWRCEISDPSHSSTATYRLTMRGRRCWDARRLSGPHWDSSDPPPARASGCATLGHQFWGS